MDGIRVSSSSQPAIMAIMLQQLDVHPGRRVLEIGAGTGYSAALLAHLVGQTGQVVTVDIDPPPRTSGSGSRARLASWLTATYSAYVPAEPSGAMSSWPKTRSPGANRVVSSPTDSTTPARSAPRINGNVPAAALVGVAGQRFEFGRILVQNPRLPPAIADLTIHRVHASVANLDQDLTLGRSMMVGSAPYSLTAIARIWIDSYVLSHTKVRDQRAKPPGFGTIRSPGRTRHRP